MIGLIGNSTCVISSVPNSLYNVPLADICTCTGTLLFVGLYLFVVLMQDNWLPLFLLLYTCRVVLLCVVITYILLLSWYASHWLHSLYVWYQLPSFFTSLFGAKDIYISKYAIWICY